MPRNTKIDSTSKRTEQKNNAEALHQLNDKLDSLQVTAPRHLDPIASRLWTQLVPALNESGLATSADKSTLEAFCMAYSVMRKAWESIKTESITYTAESSSRTYKNPAVDILDKSQSQINSLGKQLGLSPQARANLTDVNLSDQSDDFENIMKQFGGGE